MWVAENEEQVVVIRRVRNGLGKIPWKVSESERGGGEGSQRKKVWPLVCASGNDDVGKMNTTFIDGRNIFEYTLLSIFCRTVMKWKRGKNGARVWI